jgi:hypothetical protein
MQALPNVLNIVVTYVVPTAVWGLLTVGVYQLVSEGRETRMHQEQWNDLTSGTVGIPYVTQPLRAHNRAAILEVLDRAGVDDAFIAQLTHEGPKALEGYDLTPAEQAALLSGDIRWIEDHVGKLTPRQKTWLYCRLEQEIW